MVSIALLQDFPITYATFYTAWVFGGYWVVYLEIKNNKFERPLWVALGAFIIITASTAIAGLWSGLQPSFALFIPVPPGLFFGFATWFIAKDRDIGGINLGEIVLSDFAEIDKQFCFILNAINKKMDNGKIHQAINNAFSYILGSLYNLLKMGIRDNSHISVMQASGGRLTIIASEKVTAQHAEKLHQTFRYGNNPNGLAGYAATRQEKIYIPDLQDEEDPNVLLWVALDQKEKRKGSIICLPLVRGLRGNGNKNETIGVLSLTSQNIDAFGTPYKQNLIDRFCHKIELLLYMLEIVAPGS